MTNGIDANKVVEDLQNGDVGAFESALKSVAANAYTAAMQQTNILLETKIEEATKLATEQASSSLNANLAVSQMQQKLEFTKDPDIEPMAKAALSQALKRGDDVETAIASVEKFFMKAAGNISKAMRPPSSTNSGGNPQFPSDANNNNSGHASHDEWLAVLTGRDK